MHRPEHSPTELTSSSEDFSNAEFEMIEAGWHTVRAASWRLERPSAHLPLLFFNGIGANIEAMAPLAEKLTARPFITFDMPGIGQSPDPVLPYNFMTMAHTASRVLDHFGIKRADIMGFSWGGALAQQFAFQYAARVRKLVLTSTFPGFCMVPGNFSIFSRPLRSRQQKDAQLLNEHLLSLYGKTGSIPANHTKFMRAFAAPRSRGFLYQVAAISGWTGLPILPFLAAPTLVLTGDEDQIVPPANSAFLATMIPGATRKSIAGAGHLVLLTDQEEVTAILNEFLD